MKSLIIFLRKVTCIIFFLLITLQMIYSQGITSLSIQPQNPTTIDQVKLVADVWIHTGPCTLDSSNVTKTGSNFTVNGYYNSGMLTVICPRIDTITLGIIESGTFTLKYFLHHTSYNVPKDSMNITFIVSPMVGIDGKMSLEILSIFPNPVDDEINIILDENPANRNIQIDMYSFSGKLVGRYIPKETESNLLISTSTLPVGLYFLNIYNERSLIGLAKINVLR